MCISVFGPSSSPSNSLAMLFINSAFSLCFLIAIFKSKIVRFLLHPVAGMFSCHLLPVVGRIFSRCFGMFSFVCIVLPFVDISLIFLLSPVLSGLFPQVVLLSFLVLPFTFCFYIFQRLSFVLSFWPVFVDFFICVSSRIPNHSFDLFYAASIFFHPMFTVKLNQHSMNIKKVNSQNNSSCLNNLLNYFPRFSTFH